MNIFQFIPVFFLVTFGAICSEKSSQYEVATERFPATPYHEKTFLSHPALQSSPLRGKKTILEIDHPLEEHETKQLQGRNLREIYLTGVFVGYEQNDYFIKKYSLSISPETINPDVEVLSLKSCGLTDESIKEIGKFNKLKKLNLVSNHLTDGCIAFIANLKDLRSLSLALNRGISNLALTTLLAMPNLEELDVSHNKKINDEGGKIILNHNKKIVTDLSHTSISIKTQLEIKKKQQNA